MYNPPPVEIFDKLTDSNVELISFGKYVMHISFENEYIVSIYAPFRFEKENVVELTTIYEFPVVQTQLTRIIGFNLKGIKCEEDGTLWLNFSNGDMLIIYANNPMYEAYRITIEGKEYLV